jgi:hypothetical protein
MKFNFKLYNLILFLFCCALGIKSFAQDATFFSSEPIKCANQDGSPVLFTLKANNTNYALYEWEITGPSSYKKTFTGDNQFSSIIFPLPTIGSYDVSLKVNGLETESKVDFLRINPLPSITINIPSTVCQNASNNFSISLSPSGFDLISTKIGTSTYTSENFFHTFITAGSQLITTNVTSTNGCSATKTESVNVREAPALTSTLSPSGHGSV